MPINERGPFYRPQDIFKPVNGHLSDIKRRGISRAGARVARGSWALFAFFVLASRLLHPT